MIIARQRAAGLVAALVVLGFGSAPATQAAEQVPAARERVEVTVANRPIITLFGPLAGHHARDRAEDTTARIYRVLAGDRSPLVSTQASADGTEVLIGGKRAYVVTRIDIDPEFGETTDNVAHESAARLSQAVAEYAEQHTTRFLALAALWTALATAFYYLFVRTTFGVNHRIAARLAPIAATRTERVKIGGASLFDASTIAALTRRLVRFVAWIIALTATYVWLTFSLSRFPYSRPWGERMADALLLQAGDIARAIADSIPGLLVAVVIFAIARAIVRCAALFFDRLQSGRAELAGFDADTVAPTRWLFSVIVYLFALGFAYPYLPGANTDAFKGLSVLVGLMVSIGASGLAGQGLAGLILMYSRVIRPGEAVKVGDVEGTVKEVGAFTTRIHTAQDHEVLLSNTQILQTATRNFSRTSAGARCTIGTTVTIGYATPWRQVVAMLEIATHRTSGIATRPEPFVRQMALSDFYVEYRLVAYLPGESAARRLEILDRLHANVLDVFNEYGVQITSPHYEVDPPALQVVPREQWYTAPAAPQGTPARSAP